MKIAELLGIAALVGGALGLCFGYKNYLKHREDILIEYLSFLEHLRLKISVYGEPYSAAYRGFCANELEKSGFIGLLLQGKCLGDAFDLTESRVALTEEGRNIIGDALHGLGKSGLTDEVKRLDGYITLLKKHTAEYSTDRERRTKSIFAMAMAAVCGISILLL